MVVLRLVTTLTYLAYILMFAKNNDDNDETDDAVITGSEFLPESNTPEFAERLTDGPTWERLVHRVRSWTQMLSSIVALASDA